MLRFDKILGRLRQRDSGSGSGSGLTLNDIIDLMNGVDKQSRLISGSVNWLQNLDFDITPLVYQILGTRYTAAGKMLVIPDNVAANPVFAVIYADVNGNIGYIVGEPAVNPAIPLIDSTTQLLITPVLIPAGGSEPSDITTKVIYDENIEWATDKTEESGVTIDLESTIDPHFHEKHINIEIDGIGTSGYVIKSQNVTNPSSPGRATVSIDEETSSIFIPVSQLFENHKTSLMILKKVFYYDLLRPQDLQIMVTLHDGTEIPVTFEVSPNKEEFSIPELGLYVEVTDGITITSTAGNFPLENITITANGFKLFTLLYEPVDETTIQPVTSQITFTNNETIDISQSTISLSIKISDAWSESTELLLQLFNGINKVGEIILNASNSFGFNPVFLNYQRITIPVSSFNPVANDIDRLTIRPVGSWKNPSTIKIDYIVLQSGLVNQPESDFYLKSVSIDNSAKMSFERSANLQTLELQLGTMALKKFWFGSQAEYDAIAEKDDNTIYFIPVADGDAFYTSVPMKKYKVPGEDVNGVVTDDETDTRTGNSVFNLPVDFDSTSDLFVYVGGLLKDEGTHYTKTDTQVTFLEIPIEGNAVVFQYTPNS